MERTAADQETDASTSNFSSLFCANVKASVLPGLCDSAVAQGLTWLGRAFAVCLRARASSNLVL